MADYRGSFRKTVLAAGTVLVLGLIILAGLADIGWLGQGRWSLVQWLLWGSAVVVLVVALVWFSLILAGGWIALGRDALEAEGRPYARFDRREAVSGAVRGALRRTVNRFRPAGPGPLGLRPGELVEIRSLDEILPTLDQQGTLRGLPFMPEMAVLCGRRARVFRRVDKLNDWIGKTGLRRLHDTVQLEALRCNGSSHGGCQANCHLRWNEAWLRRVSGNTPAPSSTSQAPPDLVRLTRRTGPAGETLFTCQGTELTSGTSPLDRGDPRHYARDLLLGNVRLRPFAVGVAIACFNWMQRRRGGVTFPVYSPSAPKTTPHLTLDLQPGEAVRVRSKRDIEPTLNAASSNRGLWFDADMLRFCGGEYRVGARVERLIVEKSGKLTEITNPAIILDGVHSTGEYMAFNPENESIFWREIWLERVQTPAGSR